MIGKRKHPKFLRPNFGRTSRSRIKRAWRRPRGIDNKKREKIAYMGASPSIGYGQPRKIKYLHPSGLREILVQTPSELAGLSNVAIRISSGVGRLKYEEIVRIATAAKLKILNKRKPQVKKIKREKNAARTAKPADVKAIAPAAASAPAATTATAPAAQAAAKSAQAPASTAAKPATQAAPTVPAAKPAQTNTQKK